MNSYICAAEIVFQVAKSYAFIVHYKGIYSDIQTILKCIFILIIKVKSVANIFYCRILAY